MRNLVSGSVVVSSLLVAALAGAADPDAVSCTVRVAGQPSASALRLALPGLPSAAQADLTASVQTRDLPGGRRYDLAVTDTSGAEREIVVDWEVGGPEAFTKLFLTDGNGDRALTPAGRAAYRGVLSLPAATVYGETSGLTIAAAFEVRAPELLFAWRHTAAATALTATVQHLRLPAGGTAAAGLLVGRHAGCWRPGLGWLVQCYPEYFRPPCPRVFEMDGPMIYDFVTTDERLRRDLGQGLKWQELGWYWPHLGLYRPTADTWQRQPRSEGGLGAGGEVSVTLLNDHIRRARALGVEQCLYFQSTESWADFAQQRFPESRATRPDGTVLPTWIKCVVMDPDPDRPFGRHILDQLKALVTTFPEMAGVFWDQNCYTFFDYAHDDGVSLVDGRRVSQLEFAQERMLAAGAELLHAQNRVIMTNGGWTVGLARHCDGHMSEGSGPTRRLQYICMLKHLTLLSYDSTPAAALEKLKLALETGAQPAVTLGNDACRAQYAGYRPLFELLRRREWVFEPRALTLPAGLRGNVFRTPTGNFVVTAVAEAGAILTPVARLQPAPVRLRLSDDATTAAVLEWRPELEGLRILPSRQEGPDRWVDLGQPDPCAGLVLARQGRWIVADTPRLVAGQTQAIAVRLLNLTPEPWSGNWEVTCGERQVRQTLRLAAGAAETLAVAAVAVPADATRITLRVHGPLPDGSSGDLSLDVPVVAPLRLAVPVPEPVPVIQGEELPLAIGNSLGRPLEVDLSLTWQGAAPQSTRLTLAPGAVQALACRATPPGGLSELLVTARAADVDLRQTIRVEVIAPTLPPDIAAADVESVTLTLDLFNSLGDQWAQKPVTVNGVVAGMLPVTGQTLRWHPAVTLPVAAEAAREIVRRGLQADHSLDLVVSVDNAVRNCFKVTNVQASLRTRAGVTCLSSANRQVCSSDAGWLYSEGQCVSLGQAVPLGTLRFLPAR